MMTRSALTLNRLMDRAGRHRRVAAGLALLALPVMAMGVRLLALPGHALVAVCHIAASASLAWIAVNLVRRASFVDDRGLPHASVGGIFASMVLLRLTAPEALTDSLALALPVLFGLVILGVALMVLVAADRFSDLLLGLLGRSALVVGGAFTGCVQCLRAGNGFAEYPWYSVFLAVAGSALLAMSFSEGRILRRALQMAFLSSTGRP